MKLGCTETQLLQEDDKDVMPFGKHKNKKLVDLDVKYILFILTKCEWIDDSLRTKLEQVLETKKHEIPCYGNFYDPTNRTCAACAFLEDCALELL